MYLRVRQILKVMIKYSQMWFVLSEAEYVPLYVGR